MKNRDIEACKKILCRLSTKKLGKEEQDLVDKCLNHRWLVKDQTYGRMKIRFPTALMISGIGLLSCGDYPGRNP